MVFHWSLSDSKSPQVSRTLLSILDVLNNAVVWMVSTRLSTSKSSSPFDNSVVTVPKAPIAFGIIVTFMFNSFFNSLARSMYFFFILSVLFCGKLGQQSRQFCKFSFFLLIIIRSGLLAKIRWSVCMSKSHRNLCVIFLDSCWVVHISFVRGVKYKFLAHLPVFPLALSVLYSFWANLLHLLIMWLMISSLSPHSLHLLFGASYLFSLWY